MDLHNRFDSSKPDDTISSISFFRKVGIVLCLLGAMPVLLVGFFVGEYDNLTSGWSWRNAIPAKALIVDHSVEPLPEGIGWPEVPWDTEFIHTIRYEYKAGGRLIEDEILLTSPFKESIRLEESNYEPTPGTRIQVFYQPGAPKKHRLISDPRPSFWSSVWRTGIGVTACIGIVLIVVLFVLFYRPKRRRLLKLPERIELS